MWFGTNNWRNVIYYSVAKQNADSAGSSWPASTSTTLNVSGTALGGALFFATGTPLFTPGTPPVPSVRPSNNLTDYLEIVNAGVGPRNNDGSDELYATPTHSARPRPHFHPCERRHSFKCPNNVAQLAARLLKLTPCGQPPS